MLKKSLMIGVVAILTLVAFSAVMVSDDSAALDPSYRNIGYKNDYGGTVHYDLIKDTTLTYGAEYIAFVSGGDPEQSGKPNGNLQYDKETLQIHKEVRYPDEEGGQIYKVVGLRNNAFQASKSPVEEGKKSTNDYGEPINRLNQKIEKVIIPETIQVIGVGSNYTSTGGSVCFAKCTGLKTVIFEGTPQLKTISGTAFKYTSLKSLDLSKCSGVTILNDAFGNPDLIGKLPTSGMKYIDLSGVTDLKNGAFDLTSSAETLKSIVMPADGAIDNSAFKGMKFYAAGGTTELKGDQLKGMAFKKSGDKMVPAFTATFDTNGGSAPIGGYLERVYFENEPISTNVVRGDATHYQWKDAGGEVVTNMPGSDITLNAVYQLDKQKLNYSKPYDGNVHEPFTSKENYDVTGSTTGKNADTYIVTFALKSDVVWSESNGNHDDYETTWEITRAEITVSGITAENKTYNGNTEAVLNYGSTTLSGVLTGDEVTFVSATGVFADKNVGDGKSVTIGDYVLDGADKGNYVLTTQSMTAVANITPATITVSGITASDKVFDGKATATLDKSGMVLDGKIDGDDIVIGAVGEFISMDVGNGKIVNIALGLEGNDDGNYVLASYTATTTASITPAPITGDIEQEGSLIYDGTAQVADVYSTLVSVANEPITVKYSTSRTGEYSSDVPAFTSVGKYTVYYTAEAPNHEVKTGSFTVTVAEPHNSDIEGGDHVLLLVMAGIAVVAAAMLIGPFLLGRP